MKTTRGKVAVFLPPLEFMPMISGGEGSILGTIVGALIMTVIASGCTQRGYPNWVQEIVTGAIIIAAVALDRLRHRRAV